MPVLLDMFSAAFLQRALIGGLLVAAICAIVGTWVVIRGMAFLGEALSHGILPGVALASLIGIPTIIGAAASATVMSLGITWLSRRGRLSNDTAIGLVFVGMLSLGVLIVSRSQSFATDITAVLFGDILAVRTEEIVLLGISFVVVAVTALVFTRSFIAVSFDERKAATLGLRPNLANIVLILLVTVAVVSAYRAVGALLVVGLLLGPPAAAAFWTRTIRTAILLAFALGSAAVLAGLVASWYSGLAASAAIACTAVLSYIVSALVHAVVKRRTNSRRHDGQDQPSAVAIPGSPTGSRLPDSLRTSRTKEHTV
ncbi:zinc ABC transporter permease AztB [Humidisolicoccus flavus]|uniref:zinc ABC transporter permease AztB n=1 Tax=Humidisolicoccus flavus TaxID=3111414 RepID=UPI0032539966